MGIASSNGRSRHAAHPVSRRSAIRLTWVEEIETRAEQLDQHIADLAGRDALDIHLGQGEIERLFGTRSLLEGTRIKPGLANLRYIKRDFADAGHDRLGFETIGSIDTMRRPLMRSGTHKPGSLDFACFIVQHPQGFAGSVEPFAQKDLQGSD